jgi:beta-lactamase regulating signal transducer with metallopeptidase domain
MSGFAATPVAHAILRWSIETTVVAAVLAALAILAGRVRRPGLGPAARHALWLVVLLKLVTPPVVHWPWSLPWPLVADSGRQPSVRPATADVAAPASTDVEDEAAADDRAAQAVLAPTATEPLPATNDTVDSAEAVTGSTDRPVVASAFRSTHTSAVPVSQPAVRRTPKGEAFAPGRWAVFAWLAGSIAVGLVLAGRIGRFHRRLRRAVPAPPWLVEEARRIGGVLGVRPPELRVVREPGTPLLWCLGRPRLLVPRDLLAALPPERWRGILAHELAHLRRGDHWVRRLELAASLMWWWNPLFWLTRRRLSEEAELACDAWVVSVLPDDRFLYAESLLGLCSALSRARCPTPALGVASSGRSFERRLTMILHGRASRGPSAASALAAFVLAILAFPSWSGATLVRSDPDRLPYALPLPIADDVNLSFTLPESATIAAALVADDVPGDPDDDAPPAERRRARRSENRNRSEDVEGESELSEAFEARMEAFAERMEELGERLGRELEERLGPGSEFAERMERLGEELGKEFGPGSEFAEQMKRLGEELGKELGPGSEFAEEMKRLGEELGKELGPGSGFAEEMKRLGEELSEELGPGSEFAEQMARFGKEMADKATATADGAAKRAEQARERGREARSRVAEEREKSREARAKAREDRAASRGRTRPEGGSERDRRIRALESRIQDLMTELERLKAEDQDDPEGEDN